MHISVKTKDRVIGETFNVGEFISALEDKVFVEEFSPVTIQTENYQGRLIGVYMPKNTNEIHLLGNNYNLLGQLLYDKTEAILLVSESHRCISYFNSINSKNSFACPKVISLQITSHLRWGMSFLPLFKCKSPCS